MISMILAAFVVVVIALLAWESRRIDRTGDTFDYPDAHCPANDRFIREEEDDE